MIVIRRDFFVDNIATIAEVTKRRVSDSEFSDGKYGTESKSDTFDN